MAKQTKNTLFGYLNCPELEVKWQNILDSFHHLDDGSILINHTVAADKITLHFNGDLDIEIPIGGGGGSTVTTEEITVVAPNGNLGGYNHGDVIPVGTDLIDILTKILRDGDPMSFTLPTGTVQSTVAASLLYEIGQVLTMNLSTTFNQNDGGAKTSEQLRLDTNTNIANGTGYQLTITSVTKVIDALINYAAGSGTKTNAVGEVFTNDIDAGAIDTANLSYAGQLPYFYGKSATKPTANQALIDAGTKAVNGAFIKSANGTVTINFGATGEFVWVAIPNTAPTKNTYYKTALDTGALSLIFEDAEIVEVDSPTALWSNEDYTFYISKVAGNHNTNMEIRN